MGMAARFASAVTATSAFAATNTERAFGLAPGSVRVVPNGIDDAFLDGASPDGTGKGVLFFGRLTRAKGCDLLLDAWSRLPESMRAEHPLRFVGQGPLRRELQVRSRELGNVEFVEWSKNTELRTMISAARVVALPSLEESFGNAMIETLAQGQELLTTDAGAIPEVCGSWGTRVPAGDVEALREALAGILANSVSSDLAGQREWVRSTYSWAATAARFREIYGRQVSHADVHG
jgi:glycosyltransferase involved in cell wall biosynthesis